MNFSSPESKARVSYCDSSSSVWEHIVSLYYRTPGWIFMELGRDEVLMVPHICFRFSARSTQDKSRARIKKVKEGLLLQRPSSSHWKATATNRIHSSDINAFRKKCYYCLFHCSEVKVLRGFCHVFGLCHFWHILVQLLLKFYAVKCWIYNYSV